MTVSRPRSVAVSRTSTVPLSASGTISAASPLTLPAIWPSCAVEEDPVVELAAPAVEVGLADQPDDLREGGLGRSARRPRSGSAARGRPR